MKRPIFLRFALRNRGRKLMQRWMRLVDHFGDGNVEAAEKFYTRLVSYRKRALRVAHKLRTL